MAKRDGPNPPAPGVRDDNTQPLTCSQGGEFFEIVVRDHLGSNWSDWFQGLDVNLREGGETVLSGYVADQAALMGILNTLNRLNVILLSVNKMTDRANPNDSKESK